MFKRLLSIGIILIIIIITMFSISFADSIKVNPTREELEVKIEEVAKKRGIPTVILKSLARVESVFQQYNSDGSVYTGPRGSIGLMQINNRSAGFDTNKLKYDIQYNIEAGATMLLRKWDESVNSYGKIPEIGNMDPNILEHWYFALWAYNGWHKSNNPNVVPYRFSNFTKYYAYQDLIYMVAEKEYNQIITPIDSKLFPKNSTPDEDTVFYTPTPIHYGDIVMYTKGDIVKVDVIESLRFRSEPNGDVLGKFESGEELEVLDGPNLENGYYWYKVKNNEKNLIGWVAKNWIYKIGEVVLEEPDGNKSWAKDYILELSEKGILDEDITNFYPDRFVTREQLCAYISRALDLEKTHLDLPFDDAYDIDAKYIEHVKATSLAEYITGFSDDTFKPKNNIKREELAVILSRITFTGENIENIEYQDIDDISPWAIDSVMNVYKLGLMKGKGDNLFKPKDNLTKAEAAKVISDLIKIVNIKEM